ncbi:hypothetical protein [Kitasatospora sp. NBC_01539]|uniref:hypothetical protein n=1 Tax=Kitasatospora sp. NBC_01539 TaxID=2903577 RepID=UPI0038602EA0
MIEYELIRQQQAELHRQAAHARLAREAAEAARGDRTPARWRRFADGVRPAGRRPARTAEC